MANDLKNRYHGSLLGLAVGDAVGTTLEFKPRDTYEPLKDMVGGGPFNLPIGAWTDDTSMALCLATSLVTKNEFDARDQINRYCNWMNHGYLSSIGHCFDIGNATATALNKYLESDDPFSGSTEPHTAGNGSIMRLAPIPLFFYPNLELVQKFSAESSHTTHGAEECLDACRYFGTLIYRALSGAPKNDILSIQYEATTPKISQIVNGSYRQKTRDAIRGSGYVIESLEAALWCFYNTDSYREAVLTAANLGDDADTTAAVVGQLAGAYYGVDGIPSSWRDQLIQNAEITQLASELHALAHTKPHT